MWDQPATDTTGGFRRQIERQATHFSAPHPFSGTPVWPVERSMRQTITKNGINRPRVASATVSNFFGSIVHFGSFPSEPRLLQRMETLSRQLLQGRPPLASYEPTGISLVPSPPFSGGRSLANTALKAGADSTHEAESDPLLALQELVRKVNVRTPASLAARLQIAGHVDYRAQGNVPMDLKELVKFAHFGCEFFFLVRVLARLGRLSREGGTCLSLDRMIFRTSGKNHSESTHKW